MQTALYRHFDADGCLLYVGISLNAVQRLSQHSDSPWAQDIRNVTVEMHPTRQGALTAEAEAIRVERPLHNHQGSEVYRPHAGFKGMDPAERIIGMLGGPVKIADILRIHRTRPYRWMREKCEGGTGGLIPFRHVPRLLEEARNQGLSLDANDFLPREYQGAA